MNATDDWLAPIDALADVFDVFGLGDVMKAAGRDALFVTLATVIPALSGAADELEYYGEPA